MLVASFLVGEITSPTSPSTPLTTTSTPSAVVPVPSNQCLIDFKCLCTQSSEVKNCGNSSQDGSACHCPPAPPLESCAETGTSFTQYCRGIQCSSCSGGSPPNSFNPTLQRGQCRITWKPKWAVVGFDGTGCAPGKTCPPAEDVAPIEGCLLGNTKRISVGCR